MQKNENYKPAGMKYAWIDFLFLVVVIIIVSVFFFLFSNSYKYYDDTVISANNGWYDENNEQFFLDSLSKGSHTVSKDISKTDIENKRFCVKSVDTVFDIYADKNLIYSYRPELPDFMGVSYGMYTHAVCIPESTKALTLVIDPIFSETPAALYSAAIEDPGMFIGDIFKNEMFNFCICFLMMIAGVGMIAFNITRREAGEYKNLNFFSLGTFAILVGIWSVNDTLILQVITQNPALIRVITYFSLIFIAYPPVSFIAGVTNNKNTVLLPILILLVLVNFIVTVIAVTLNFTDYYYTLSVSQIIIVIAMIMSIYLIAKAVKTKNVEMKFLKSIFIGLSVTIIGIGIDLIKYITRKNAEISASAFTRVGVLIFLLIVGVYFIRHHNSLIIENERASVMVQLAYTDALTKMNNRLALNEKETELKRTNADGIVIQMDINNLKTVNDVYGHSEGDKHIIAAADIIIRCFGNSGFCYRTGGDEFMVIITERIEIESIFDELCRLTEQYNFNNNPPVPLSIAYGYSEFSGNKISILEGERIADEKMYEKKRQMKSVNC